VNFEKDFMKLLTFSIAALCEGCNFNFICSGIESAMHKTLERVQLKFLLSVAAVYSHDILRLA
jgi:hypothetical protein